MSYVVRRWDAWQGRALSDVKRKRNARGTENSKPYSMPWIAVASAFDGQFSAFAEHVKGAEAESYLLRVLQHVALHSPFDGSLNVSPEAFGPYVLTRPWDIVSKARGKRVLAALVAAGVLEKSGTVSGTSPGTVPIRREERRGEENPHPKPLPQEGPSSASPNRTRRLRASERRMLPRRLRYAAEVHQDGAASKARRTFDAGTMTDEDAIAWTDRLADITQAKLTNFERNG